MKTKLYTYIFLFTLNLPSYGLASTIDLTIGMGDGYVSSLYRFNLEDITGYGYRFAGAFQGTSVDGDVTHLFCVDIVTAIPDGTYEFTVNELDSMHSKYHEAAWLMDRYSGSIATLGAPLQVAIWEVIHESEDNGFNLYDGTFNIHSAFVPYDLLSACSV